MAMPTRELPVTLREARRARRLSQLELSLRLGVSQRHVSFVETGRSRPSRPLLLSWLQELEAPLGLRNEALLQAGYAPAYGTVPLGDPAMGQANQALERLLAAHDPMPAMVLDAEWNLLRMNRGGRWLATTLMPALAGRSEPGPVNLLDLLIHPEGLTAAVLNLPEVGPATLTFLRHEASVQPSLAAKVDAFAALLRQRLGAGSLPPAATPTTAPLMTTRYATPHGELSFFSMFTTFGTPQDITLASLRVEHLFAADEVTDAVLRRQVP
jgi:transcriptional regulator with XRE-family HTH domain